MKLRYLHNVADVERLNPFCLVKKADDVSHVWFSDFGWLAIDLVALEQ